MTVSKFDDGSIDGKLKDKYNLIIEDYGELSKHDPFSGGQAVGCTRDRERSLTLMQKVYDTTEQGDVAIDIGAGLGLLGTAALVKGADFVYFVDGNFQGPLTAYISSALTGSEYDGRFKVIKKDVVKEELGLPNDIIIDHVVCELIETGLIRAPQVEAMDKIIEGRWTHENTKFTPRGARSSVYLVDGNNQQITSKQLYSDVDFSNPCSKTDSTVTLQPLRGIPNKDAKSAIITTQLYYEDGTTTGQFATLCQPERLRIVDVNGNEINPSVKGGKGTFIKLSYEYGCFNKPNVTYINTI